MKIISTPVIKTLSVLFVVFLTMTSNQASAASKYDFNKIKDGQSDTLTVSFKVNGNATCKSAIESLLTTQAGVISASWETTSKIITVVFKSSQLKTSDLYSLLAMAGYDNAELRSKQAAYDALSAECKYTREAETE